MERKTAIILSVLFVAAISVPLAFLMLSGSAPEIENRAQTELEAPDLAAVLDEEWYSEVNDVVTERFVLRDEAVRAKAWLDYNLLGESPTEEVVIGDEKWLFLTSSVRQPCPDRGTQETVVHDLSLAADVLAAVDKDLRVVVAPDKASVYPEKLGPDAECAVATAKMFGAVDHPSLVVTWDRYEHELHAVPTHYWHDTHWSTYGASVTGEALVDSMIGGLWDPDSFVQTADREWEGDLTTMIGLPMTLDAPEFQLSRPGAAEEPERVAILWADGTAVDSIVGRRYVNELEEVVPGRTVVIHDSFGWDLIKSTHAYFEDVTYVRADTVEPGFLRGSLAEADTVVLQFAQRYSLGQVGNWRLTTRLVAAYATMLPAVDAAVNHTEGGFALTVDPTPETSRFVVVSTDAYRDPCELSIDGGGRRAIGGEVDQVAFPIRGESVVVSHDCGGALRVSAVAIPRP